MTDSTCDLPRDVVGSLGVGVVGLTVAFGSEPARTRDELSDEEFYRRLAAGEGPAHTSQPSEPRFLEAWTGAVEAGADAIVSLHVASALSGTADRAATLAPSASVPVHVVDSGQVSGGRALQVLAAARAAGDGADVETVVAAAARVREATTSVLALDTLEHMRRGGRFTGAEGSGGPSLRVRPLLRVADGRIELIGRSRTWRRAIAALTETVADAAGHRPQHVVVAHGLHEDRAAALSTSLRERIDVAEHHLVVIGPVVGTHTGPGTVGVASAPASG